MKQDKKAKKYTFRIKQNKTYKGIILQDKTQLIITKLGLSLMFPKTKFSKIFEKQIKDKTRTHIGITFDYQELNALIIGLDKLL